MKIALSWINDFVKLPDLTPKEISETFTLKTAEVEGVEVSGEHFENIFVAEIKSLKKHPEADKLNLVTIHYGGKDSKEIVCGAPNVKVGLKVPYAPISTVLPGGFKLEPKKIRGILSEGMLCSEKELDLGEGASGLMELPSNALVGETLSALLGKDKEIILDVDNKSLTHRPDLWGMYGLAREFAAGFELELKNPYDLKWQKSIESFFNAEKSPIVPEVKEGTSCLAYWGISIDNITVQESPDWIKNRLLNVGLRSINNIVDISNYVMMELGIPLHIFDRKSISDQKIIIDQASAGESFITLDEIKRDLKETDTIIKDSTKSLVLAGVMGGLNSGVTKETTQIFIEVANWQADNVRKTSTRLGLRTDSSARYEKSLDSLACYKTLLRTIDLIKTLCPKAKVVGKPEYDGLKNEANPLVLSLSHEKLERTLGISLEQTRVLNIFKSLDFLVELKDEIYQVTLPTFRTTKDIECDADLIEEIGRIIGYGSITPTAPLQGVAPIRLTQPLALNRKIGNYLTTSLNALEVITYPLVGQKLLDKASWIEKNESLKLVNALSVDADRMRPSLIPSALEAVSKNSKNYQSFKFFETGRSYLSSDKSFAVEHSDLVIAFYDKTQNCFKEALNTAYNLLTSLGVSFNFSGDHPKFKNPLFDEKWIGVHPIEKMNIQLMGQFQGTVLSIHPLLLRDFKIKGHVSLVVIRLDQLEKRGIVPKIQYKPLPKFPSSTFDCTVLVPKNQNNIEPLNILKKVKIKEMVNAKIVTVFKLNEDFDAITLQATFLDPEQTLAGEFTQAAQDKIIGALAQAGFSLKN